MRFASAGGEIAAPWLSLTGLGYEPLGDAGAIVRLMATLHPDRRGFPTDVALLVERRRALTRRTALLTSIEPRRGSVRYEVGPARSLLWEVSFDLPLAVVESPRSLFTLTASNRLALAMPAPTLCEQALEAAANRCERDFSVARIRRHAVAFTAGVAVAVATGSAGGAALAGTTASSDTVSTAVTSTDTTTTAPDAPAPTVTTPEPTVTTPTPTVTTPTTTTPTPTTPTATTQTATTTTPTVTTPVPEPTAPAPAPAPAPTAPTLAPTVTTLAPAVPTTTATVTTPVSTHRQPSTGSRHQRGRGGKHRGHPATQGHRPLPGQGTGTSGKDKPAPHRRAARKSTHALAGFSTPPVPPTILGNFNPDPFTAGQLSRLSSLLGASNQPPAFLIPIYKAAGRRYHVPWQILAAINAIETDYGRDLNVSSAGAIGWMQFMPTTWIEYGVDVTGHGRPNAYDPRDAIFAAARYLAANGAAHDIRAAIFAYNHALWYVDAVLWRSQTISDKAAGFGLHGTGYALPLDARYMSQLGRTDDGLDIETAPDGAAVYSITPGVVTAVASDPSGFGPDYPVILVTSGPLQGQYIYYGHVAASLVQIGQHVLAGQPIAVMGHTGDAASLGHGHIEIGFSDSSGSPLNHHSATAWTPSGDAMRRVLVALSRAFGIKNS